MIIILLRVLSCVLAVIPRRLLMLGGDVLGLVWFYLIPIRRTVVEQNIRLAFGPDFTKRQVNGLARNNYRHYGRVLLEIVESFSWRPEDYLRRIEYHGLDHIKRLKASGKGAYIVSLHMGNWELAIGATAATGIPFCIVVKPGNSSVFRLVQAWYRGRQDVLVLAESHTANDILRCIADGRTVGFVVDQFMGPPIGLPVQFFGHEAGTAASLALLTERRPAETILTYTFRDHRGRVHAVFEPIPETDSKAVTLAERLYQRTQNYNDVLEKVVRAYPEQWMWLHRRWKPFVGESRWARVVLNWAGGILFFVLNACSSPPAITPTGIVLPADKEIDVPRFSLESVPAPVGAATPIVPPVAPVPAPRVSSRPQTAAAKKKIAPVPSPTASAPVFRTFAKERIPFDQGERLEIDLNWMALPAGTAVLEVRPGVSFNGRMTHHLWGSILSSRLVDTIYHLENHIESFVDVEALIPYKYLLHMFETHQKKETRVQFDHPKAKAYFWSKRLSQKWGDEDVDRTDPLVPEAQDMFSALYYSRLLDYRLGESQKFPVYENGRNWEIEANPVANEFISSPAGAFQCWKLLITIKLNNVLSQTGEIAMWLSDDSKRYLVRFDAKVKIGSLIGTLVKIREKT